MKNIYIIISLIILVSLGLYFTARIDKKETTNNLSVYSNSKLGIEFTHQVGPEGYVIQESTPSSQMENMLGSIVIMQTEDAGREMPVGGEGPATMTIEIFKNTKKQWPLNWAEANTQYSNINLKMGDVGESVVGGANAIRYMADGLYASENHIVAHGGYIYKITGMFMTEDSKLRKDFAPLVNSIKFIPLSE